MHQNAPLSMQIFKMFWGRLPIPPAGGGNPLPHPPPVRPERRKSAPGISDVPPPNFLQIENPVRDAFK